MTTLSLPALDGRDPLGFLASVGVLRLVTDHHDRASALSFDPHTGCAQLNSAMLDDVDQLASTLATVFDDLDVGFVPAMPPDFPPPGAAPDRLRVPPALVAPLAQTWMAQVDPPVYAARWVRALVTDLAADREGRAAITPFAAPSGKQSFSTMFAKTNEAVSRRPTALVEALTGWRRVRGYTGEYLDHRVLMSSADAPSAADAEERGVPGATWLALMALPLFPVTARGGRRIAATWQHVGRGLVMRWPMWQQPADLSAVSTLLGHPALELRDERSLAGGDRASAQLRRLSVFVVAVASRNRVPGRKSEGVLVARHVIPV